jgi:hypothetical protein
MKIFTGLLLILFLPLRGIAQGIFHGSGYIVTVYIPDKNKSNDSTYVGDIFSFIHLEGSKEYHKIEKIVTIRCVLNHKDWMEVLKSRKGLPFIKKIHPTSGAAKLLLNDSLSNRLRKLDSIYSPAPAIATDLSRSYSTNAFVKIFKVNMLGYVDLLRGDSINFLYHGIGNNSLSFIQKRHTFVAERSIDGIKMIEEEVKVFNRVNPHLLNSPLHKVFFEIKGEIVKEYDLFYLRDNG